MDCQTVFCWLAPAAQTSLDYKGRRAVIGRPQQFLAVSGKFDQPCMCRAEEGKEGVEKAKEQRHSFSARHGLRHKELLSENEKGKFVMNGDSVLLI